MDSKDQTIVGLLFLDDSDEVKELEILSSNHNGEVNVLDDLDNIAAIEKAIKSAVSSGNEVIELSIVIYTSTTANPGVNLGARIIRACGQNNMSIDVDCYCVK